MHPNEFIKNNYQELKNICNKFSTPVEVDDLLHLCIEQFLMNKKVEQVPDKEKLYFFVKIVTNQCKSNSSIFNKYFVKHKFCELTEIDIQEEEYEESPIDLKWVDNELKKFDWYYGRLFQLYIEEGCSISKLAARDRKSTRLNSSHT